MRVVSEESFVEVYEIRKAPANSEVLFHECLEVGLFALYV